MSWYLILEKGANSRELIQVCMDIRKRDENFSYYVEKQNIIIPINNKDEGYKKGSWFNKKTETKPYYQVKWRQNDRQKQ